MYLVEFLNETEIKYVCFIKNKKNHASDRSMAYTRIDTTKFISKICDLKMLCLSFNYKIISQMYELRLPPLSRCLRKLSY